MKHFLRLLFLAFVSLGLTCAAIAADAAGTDSKSLLDVPISQWQLNGVTFTLLAMFLGRIYNGARTRGGVVGCVRAFLFGDGVPKVIADDYKKELATGQLAQPAAQRVGIDGIARLLVMLFVLGGAAGIVTLSTGCASLTAPASATQIEKISAVVRATTATATSAVVIAKPDSAASIRAVAEALRVAADSTYDPAELMKIVTRVSALSDSKYSSVTVSAFTLAFGVYQTFYALNVQNAVDARPAFKAVLLAIADGAKAGSGGAVASAGGDPLADLSFDDLKLR